jgi:hypothetical protein
MRWSDHYEQDRRHQPDRRDITLEMCEQVKAKPLQSYMQKDGRTVYKGHVPDKGKYLRVVVLPDAETVWTAHWDRNFRKKVERGEISAEVERKEEESGN